MTRRSAPLPQLLPHLYQGLHLPGTRQVVVNEAAIPNWLRQILDAACAEEYVHVTVVGLPCLYLPDK